MVVVVVVVLVALAAIIFLVVAVEVFLYNCITLHVTLLGMITITAFISPYRKDRDAAVMFPHVFIMLCRTITTLVIPCVAFRLYCSHTSLRIFTIISISQRKIHEDAGIPFLEVTTPPTLLTLLNWCYLPDKSTHLTNHNLSHLTTYSRCPTDYFF
jgi:hypothetical protein